MFKRPSSRRKSNQDGITLNLVPILDAMVTLIGFMLFTTSFLGIVSVESPFPVASIADVQKRVEERPLQLTLSLHEKNTEIWSPFDRIKSQTIPHLEDQTPDYPKIHEALLEIKQQFLKESKIILVPMAGTNYDTLVSLMDSVRVLEPTDPALFIKNETSGIDEPVKSLFPEVVFGNLLGDL